MVLTSHGANIVGQPQIEQIIYIKEKKSDTETFGLYTLDSKEYLIFQEECRYAHGTDGVVC